MGLLPSTLILSSLAIIFSVLITIILFYFTDIEIAFRYVILAAIVPACVAPPIIIFCSKIAIKLAETQQHLKEKTENLERALSEIKQLSGMLPICSSCKKIRDDNGYWNLLESYIESHSDALFSHGMCPDCSDQIYGNEAWYLKMKKGKNIK